MKNLKTTLAGYAGALVTVAPVIQQAAQGHGVNWLPVVSAVFMALLGQFAKDAE